MCFFLQRIGYLAASQCFHESTDVIMLTTNQIRKVSVAIFPWLLACRSLIKDQLWNLLFPSLSYFFLIFCFLSLFHNFFSLRIWAVLTSTTLAWLSLASPASLPLTWLGIWPMTSWLWWVTFSSSRVLAPHFCLWFHASLTSLSLGVCCRCPTQSLISGRRQSWSCTRCSWSTPSLCAQLSPGWRRNWKILTLVRETSTYLPTLLVGARHMLSPRIPKYAVTKEMIILTGWKLF